MNFKFKNLERFFISFLGLGLVFLLFECTQVLPELPEKESGPPSITLKTLLDDENQPITHNGLIETKTQITFFAEAADVRDETISYSWYIDNILEADVTTEFFHHAFFEPGNYTVKVIATTGTESTEATLNIAVFEINEISGRSIENGSYVSSFDSDDDGVDETYTYVFSGVNKVDLIIEGIDFHPANQYTLSGEYRIEPNIGSDGSYMNIDFLIKEDNEFGDTWHNLFSNVAWIVFDFENETYLYTYPMQEVECWDDTPFAINRQYESDGNYNGLDYADSWNTNTKMIKDGITCNYSFFAGIDQDSLPVIKYFEEEVIEWDFDELLNGAFNHIEVDDVNHLYYSGSSKVMHSAMLFEKQ